MTETAKMSIALMEEMYTSRMTELVELESFGDAHSLFEEFVVDSEEPDKYMIVKIKSKKNHES
jgi:hypothetical protein|tara:strand:+ start:931 stop:1119 length:189 start_codon:yes stop_codon:yes gene_type:complete